MDDQRSANPAIGVEQAASLRRWNLIAGGTHLIQAVAVLVLANGFSLPVRASYMTGPPGSKGRDVVVLFNAPIGWLVAAFFLLSAAAHLLLAGPLEHRYETDLARRRNPYRWIEYSASSSIMIVLIALLTGIDDIAALIALIGVNASMIGFGWIEERYEEPGASLMPFWLGCLAGVAPWLAIGVYLIGPGSSASPPGFVYGIFFSLFLLFNVFALTQWLQYKKIGRWADYLVGERTYLVLSLVAKSLLAWQIFASTLAS
jgi:hypothetical protein